MSILASVVSSAILNITATSALGAPQGFVASTYGHPQRLVVADGDRRLNLICLGHGRPTVIFLAGLGSAAIDWRRVQPAIGQVTQACAYDRAGYGFSDPADRPSDATNAVSDLHALLHASKLQGPVVLVGHSLGGLYATLYAKTYPKDVAGMVLVERAFSGQSKAIADAVGPVVAQQLAASQMRTLAAVDQCAALAKSGRLSLRAEATSDCLDNPPDPEPDVHAQRNRVDRSADYELALRDEFKNANVTGQDGMTVDDRESAHPSTSLGPIPLVVLTRGDVNALPGQTAETSDRAESAWRAGHDRLAALSNDGINIVVPHTGHFIQLEQSPVVIEQIKRVLAKARRASAL